MWTGTYDIPVRKKWPRRRFSTPIDWSGQRNWTDRVSRKISMAEKRVAVTIRKYVWRFRLDQEEFGKKYERAFLYVRFVQTCSRLNITAE